MPSAPPPTAARYSLSQELKAMLFWERDRLVTARPFRKIIADETECLLRDEQLDWSPAQSESVNTSTSSEVVWFAAQQNAELCEDGYGPHTVSIFRYTKPAEYLFQ